MRTHKQDIKQTRNKKQKKKNTNTNQKKQKDIKEEGEEA